MVIAYFNYKKLPLEIALNVDPVVFYKELHQIFVLLLLFVLRAIYLFIQYIFILWTHNFYMVDIKSRVPYKRINSFSLD